MGREGQQQVKLCVLLSTYYGQAPVPVKHTSATDLLSIPLCSDKEAAVE